MESRISNPGFLWQALNPHKISAARPIERVVQLIDDEIQHRDKADRGLEPLDKDPGDPPSTSERLVNASRRWPSQVPTSAAMSAKWTKKSSQDPVAANAGQLHMAIEPAIMKIPADPMEGFLAGPIRF